MKFLAKDLVKIKVVGVGGCGGNVVSRMQLKEKIRYVDFIVVNTDIQDLENSFAKHKISIGKDLTGGLGAGMNPEIGREAALSARDKIKKILEGAGMVFVTAGFGGGTGTGASPVICEIAKELGALTIGVITKPFSFEGSQRERIAKDGLSELKNKVDALIVIKNDKIFSIIEKDTPLLKAFEAIDDILKQAVEGIIDLIVKPGIINVDFADVKLIMKNAGSALVGIGFGKGEDRAIEAAKKAIESPLLEASIDGARGVLLNIGGRSLKMQEIQEVANLVKERVSPDAKIICGAFEDRRLNKEEIKVISIACGFDPTLNNFSFHQESILEAFKNKKDIKEKTKEKPSSLLELKPKENKESKNNKDKKNKKDNKDKKSFQEEIEKSQPKISQIKDYFDIPALFRRKKKKR